MTARATDIAPPNPSGLCFCGCGGTTPIADQSDRARGRLIGHHVKYIVGHNQRRPAGSHKGKYLAVSCPTHPRRDSNGCIYAHIAVAEKALGRVLPHGVEVHHVDGNGQNNANRNLVICQDKAYHKLLHVRQRVIAAGGNPNTQRVCGSCKEPKLLGEFYRRTATKADGYGRKCKACASSAFAGWRQRKLARTAAA